VVSAAAGATDASITVTGPEGKVAGATTHDPTTGVVGFTPAGPLAWDTSYRASASADGSVITSWSFRTARAPALENSAAFIPDAALRPGDESDLQVGTRFSPTVAGSVSGIRVFTGDTGADDTATRTGYLWGADGKLLATVAFADEAVNGWQTGTLGAAIDLTAGTEYRVTVNSSTDRYARLPNALATPLVNGFLSMPASAGAYGYSNPDQTSADSYLVDVIFSRTP
jgi:hypothetical protein